MYEDDHLESDYEDRNGGFVDENVLPYEGWDDSDESDIPEDSVIDVETRVSAGMAYLDMNYPNHTDRVNLDNLDVDDVHVCPLAQAAKTDYTDAMDKAGPFGTWDARVGFAQAHGFSPYNDSDSDNLTQEWVSQYQARKDAQVALS